MARSASPAPSGRPGSPRGPHARAGRTPRRARRRAPTPASHPQARAVLRTSCTARRSLESRYVADLRIVVLEGDETGQELLEQALRVLDPSVTEVQVQLDNYDLSLENRRKTENEVVMEAAAAIREAGLSVKAATITPEGADDVGS